MVIKLFLVSLFVFFNRVKSRTSITFPSTEAVVGEDARLECTFGLDGRIYSASNLVESDAAGNQFDLLVSSSSTSAPGSKYRVEEDLANDRVFFVITNTARSDDGYYLCVIENSGLDVPSNTPSKLTVQYIETVTIDIVSNPVTEGDFVTFACSVDASPVPTIILYKEETKIIRGTTKDLKYNISSVKRSDGGKYKCEARNIAGSNASQFKELDFYYPPEIVLPDNMTVVPGEIVVIAPEVSANPGDITYQWITYPPGINDFDTNPATFVFKASEVVDTNYTITVTATNIIGSTTKSVKVTVLNVDYCLFNPCENEGTCTADCSFNCECKPGYSGRLCENEVSNCPSSTSLIIGMFFVGITVGAFGVITGLIVYTKINKQKTQIDKRNTEKQDTYMNYMADRPTGNDNQTYQDLQHREEERAYVNVKPGVNRKY